MVLIVLSVALQAGQKVDNLYEDFRDGQKLLLLLELLTESKLVQTCMYMYNITNLKVHFGTHFDICAV